MTGGGGDGEPWRHIARGAHLIRAGAGLRDREGLFFQTGRAELRVDRRVGSQSAGPIVLVNNGVGGGRLEVGIGAVIIVLVLGRYHRGAGDERRRCY